MWKRLLSIGLVGSSMGLNDLRADEPLPVTPEKTSAEVEMIQGEAEDVSETTNDPGQSGAGRLWLGIAFKGIAGDLALFLGDDYGVLVDDVQPNSPAALAGLKPGDILLAVDGKRLGGPDDLLQVMQTASMEQPLQLSVLRRMERIDIPVSPAPRPAGARFEFSLPEIAKGLEDLGGFRFNLGSDPLGDNEILMFRMADPQLLMRGKRFDLKGDFKFSMTTTLEGETVNLTATRTADQPIEIVVKRGDQVQTLTEDQLEQLPESLRNWVQSVIGGENNSINLGPLGNSSDLQNFLSPEELARLFGKDLREGLEQLRQRLNEESEKFQKRVPQDLRRSLRKNVDQAIEAAEKARENAMKNVEQAREAAQQWAKSAEEQLRSGEASLKAQVEQSLQQAEKLAESDQFAELKRMVEQLRQELDDLRRGLQDN